MVHHATSNNLPHTSVPSFLPFHLPLPPKFLSQIFSLQAKTGANIFATSRHISNIEKEFEGNTLLEIRASEEDVRSYLDGHMLQLPGFVTRRPEIQEEIKATIVKAVDGMYRVPLICETRRGLT
jgi:hypothetical protein